MDSAYISAFAALAGSTIGGFTALITSWLAQHTQFRAQRLEHNISKREALYQSFIEEASRLYADAYEHDKGEISNLVRLYSLVSAMRVISSQHVVESADKVARVIISTYLGPNKTFRDVTEILDSDSMDPLREFGNACREELQLRRTG